jgi:hypothetical protein
LPDLIEQAEGALWLTIESGGQGWFALDFATLSILIIGDVA